MYVETVTVNTRVPVNEYTIRHDTQLLREVFNIYLHTLSNTSYIARIRSGISEESSLEMNLQNVYE